MSEAVSFFSESDMVVMKDGSKKVSSEYPLWYNFQMTDEIREDIGTIERTIKNGEIPEKQIPVMKERLIRLKGKLSVMEEALPKVDDKTTEKFSKVRDELGKEITQLMFSRSDMKKGLADAHIEARRMEDPMIRLTEKSFDVAKACNIMPVNGKISRTQAEKIWKITGRFLGENSNTEHLRKD